MSDIDADLNLEKLFLPAWATEPAAPNRFAHYTGEEGERPGRRGDRRGDRRRDRPGPREGGPPRRQESPAGQQRPPRRDDERRRDDRRGDDRRGRPWRGPHDRQPEREERRPEQPLPEVHANVTIDEKGADTLARQIRMTGRAYPVFDIAHMILQKPERYQLCFNVIKKEDGTITQPLYLCALDDTLWLSEDEAMHHALERHFQMFYQAERTATQPPKGVYTFVAQCGFSGVILGPPNYHGYQEQLRKLHAERFSRMPFEVYKSRVKIVRDESIVKKWIEDQSWKTEYICLNVPESPRLANRESVEQHFRETHLPNIVRPVEAHTLNGGLARSLRSHGLQRLARRAVEEQRRFPLRLVNNLSQQFAARGLQFFKRDRTVTHVSVARPHYLDLENSVVSDLVRRIMEFINAKAKCTRPQLIEALAPSPPKPPPVAPPVVENAPPAENAPAAEIAAAAPPEPTPEQMAVISDLHWLIHQGHVIEFANGILETAKKPAPKPPKMPPEITGKPVADAVTQTETQAVIDAGIVSAPQPPVEKPAEMLPPQPEEQPAANTLASEIQVMESAPEAVSPPPAETDTEIISPEPKPAEPQDL